MEDLPRQVFRDRVKDTGLPDYIPLNFFLFNKPINGVDYVICDELVFQALNFPHSKSFDLLALFAFNLSMVGDWKGATPPTAEVKGAPLMTDNKKDFAGYFPNVVLI
jgi:hypothetical protein